MSKLNSMALEQLRAYENSWVAGLYKYRSYNHEEEVQCVAKFMEFLQASANHCVDRHHYFPGHLTGSAMVLDTKLEKVLLTLHRKLNIWLQLGGHADGDPDIARVAMREAYEESGLLSLGFLNFPITSDQKFFSMFDCDAHIIPARPNEPQHTHYDIRYIVVAPDPDKIVISDESQDLRWVPIPEARKMTAERSMHRQFDKVEWIKGHLLQLGVEPTWTEINV